MHPIVFNTFEEICSARRISGAVLEIGATPEPTTLLNLPSLARAGEKIGINNAFESRCEGFAILKVDANDMRCFPDQRFDVVLCNAVLEHDRYFWKTLAEIRRVVKIGGLVAIGAPGYGDRLLPSRVRRLLTRLAGLAGNADRWSILHSTFTFPVHNFPADYYRFSEQAFREVFFAGLRDVTIRTVMNPPRFIGAGTRV